MIVQCGGHCRDVGAALPSKRQRSTTIRIGNRNFEPLMEIEENGLDEGTEGYPDDEGR